ncbi:aminotransferase class V-fold PLP-dependent enzyme [Shigella flexneri]
MPAAGQHCAQPLLAELGVTGTLRASFAPYNTKSDVDALVNAVDRALELLVVNDKPAIRRTSVRHNRNRRNVTQYLRTVVAMGR